MPAPDHLGPPALAPFSIQVLSAGDRATRIVVEGELDLQTSPELESALDRELELADSVLLDLSKVQFIDSTGLHAILLVLERGRTNGDRLRIKSELPAQARRLFELAGVLELLPLIDD